MAFLDAHLTGPNRFDFSASQDKTRFIGLFKEVVMFCFAVFK